MKSGGYVGGVVMLIAGDADGDGDRSILAPGEDEGVDENRVVRLCKFVVKNEGVPPPPPPPPTPTLPVRWIVGEEEDGRKIELESIGEEPIGGEGEEGLLELLLLAAALAAAAAAAAAAACRVVVNGGSASRLCCAAGVAVGMMVDGGGGDGARNFCRYVVECVSTA